MCIKHIDAAWHEVSQISMNDVWKALCPQFDNSVQGENEQKDEKILENLIEIFKKLDIDLEEEDFQKLFEPHLQELTNEELMELETMQGLEEDEKKEIFPVKKFETKLMADGFNFMKKALTICENQDLNFERFSKVATSFQCYYVIYDKKKKRQCKHS